MPWFIKSYGIPVAAIFGLIVISVIVLNQFSYFDPFSLCYIGIDGDMIRGNDNTITDAIKLLKKEDPRAYGTACKYVDAIIESECENRDGNIAGSNVRIPGPACYIRGSKVIYITPTKKDTPRVVRERMELIREYSLHSKNFWTGKK